MTEKGILFEQKGKVGLITLNRPEHLNAFNYDTLSLFHEIVEQLRMERNRTGVVIITGAGRAFSAGADLKERKNLSDQEVLRNVRLIRELFTSIEQLPQPSIAAINGYAFGGGLELALACDFRYAVKDTLIGLTEVSLGIIPGAGGTKRLARLVGIAKAKEWILTARKIPAEVAYQAGLLNGLAGSLEELMKESFQLAEEILQNAPLAVSQAKEAIMTGEDLDLPSALVNETKAYEALIGTKDRVEALKAFAEKRKPHFTGE